MVKRYDISCFGGMHMDECGDGAYVNYEDYAELESKLETALRECRSAGITIDNLEAKCAALAADNEKAMEAMRQADSAVKLAREKFSALAAENAGLKKFCKDAAFDADYEAELGMERGGFSDALNEIKTPATDAFLAEVRALAAESAAMLETIEAVRSVADNSSGIAGWHLNGDIATWEEILPEINDIETPATDAFLDEVRAQGVEMAMEHMQSSGSLTFGDCYISLNEFAAQLRKGVRS